MLYRNPTIREVIFLDFLLSKSVSAKYLQVTSAFHVKSILVNILPTALILSFKLNNFLLKK